jgi:hypothetical protein
MGVEDRKNEPERITQRLQGARGLEDSVADDRVPTTGDVLTFNFLTPTTLKSGSGIGRDGSIVRQPAFHHVFKRLRDRLNALSTFYGNGPIEMDFKAAGEAAEAIETVEDHTRWVERSRFSRRREVAHDLSGFVGARPKPGRWTEWADSCLLPRLLRSIEVSNRGPTLKPAQGVFTVAAKRSALFLRLVGKTPCQHPVPF